MVCAVPALLFGRGIEVDSSGGLRPQGWVFLCRGRCVRAVCVHGARVARLLVCASAAFVLFARRFPLTTAIAFDASQVCC